MIPNHNNACNWIDDYQSDLISWNFHFHFHFERDFVMALTDCEKLLLCGLTGSVIGLGVTMLAYFDGVYASDKATFHLPYVQLGQGTEGGLPLTFRHYAASNQLVGRTSNPLFFFPFFFWFSVC